jgi:hypothetical protein
VLTKSAPPQTVQKVLIGTRNLVEAIGLLFINIACSPIVGFKAIQNAMEIESSASGIKNGSAHVRFFASLEGQLLPQSVKLEKPRS